MFKKKKGRRAVVQPPLRTSEEVLLKERTDTQDVRRHTTEADDQQRDEHSQRQVDGEVVLVDLEERTNARQVGQEQIVDEIDVQRAASDILQAAPYDRHLREILVVITEIHEHDGEQRELRQRQGHYRPLHTQLVPLQRVHRTENHHDDQQREEPTGVHHALPLVPIAMHDIAIEEERHIEHHLDETGVVEERRGFHAPATKRPPELMRQVARLVDTQRHEEQQGDGYPRLPPQLALQIGEQVVDNEHIEQGDGEPVATLQRRVELQDDGIDEIIEEHSHTKEEEHHRRDDLYAKLLTHQATEVGKVPYLRGLIRQESADEEEQRHTEKDEKRQGRGEFHRLHESRLTHMVGNHEDHRESSHGIEPF